MFNWSGELKLLQKIPKAQKLLRNRRWLGRDLSKLIELSTQIAQLAIFFSHIFSHSDPFLNNRSDRRNSRIQNINFIDERSCARLWKLSRKEERRRLRWNVQLATRLYHWRSCWNLFLISCSICCIILCHLYWKQFVYTHLNHLHHKFHFLTRKDFLKCYKYHFWSFH